MTLETDFNYEEYEKRRIESAKAEGLRFVPETGPKVFCVVCANAEDWTEIHNYIVNENEIDGIPNRKINCINPKKTCDRIGSYEMSDEEAEQLKNHPKIIGVNIDEGYYEGTYKGRDTYLMSTQPASKTSRYGGNVKISRDNSHSGYYTGTDSTWLSKTAAQIYRHQTLDNPWKNRDDNTLLTDNPEQYGDGTDVDLIVNDSAAWLGHIEFVKTGTGEPTNFAGTNVLKSGFATSATTGVCGVLDLILSAPYYIDPDFFEADPSNRLRVRWDGTTVPVESVARNWWGNESTTYRSAKYVSSNISGGTAVIGSREDFGTISISNNYTEAIHNGDIDTLHTGKYPPNSNTVATHGTPCMSQAYGKTHGWAYNSNKWFISILWASGAISTSILYEVLKVFHDLKPNRSSDNTKNPTVCSNSWGSTVTFTDKDYAYFRTSGDGTGGEIIDVNTNTPIEYGEVNSPAWLSKFYSEGSNQHAKWIPPTDSIMVEGAAMLDSGVIWLGAAGNNNNQQVKGDHPNYNNYVGDSNATLAQAEADNIDHRMVNRVSNPNCIGCVQNYNGGGVDVYRTFNVGALDDDTVNNSGTYQEQKAIYSNMGNAIDFYTIGDGSIGAQGGGSNQYSRNDSSYRLDSSYNIVSSGGTLSLTSYDKFFSGTSSACPVGAGLFATKMQHNRNWTWSNLKNWLENEVTDQPNDSLFFQGTEATTSSSSDWNSQRNLQGGSRTILWDASTVSSSDDDDDGPDNPPISGLKLEWDAANSSSYSGSGNIWYDLSGFSHDGTITNANYVNTNPQYFDFNGENTSVESSQPVTLYDNTPGTEITVESWINADSFTSVDGDDHQTILGGGGNSLNFDLSFSQGNASSQGNARGRIGGANPHVLSSTLNTEQWYHILFTYSSQRYVRIYVNGIQEGIYDHGSSLGPTIPASLNAGIKVGEYLGPNSFSLDGKISKIRVYNRALLSTEITQNYNEFLNRFYPSTPSTCLISGSNLLLTGNLIIT